MNTMTLTPGHLSFIQLREIWQQPVKLSLDAGAIDAINASVACVNNIVAEGRTAYGINTGFGLLAQTRIATEDLQNLQRSLVLSHAAGVGEALDDAMVRLIMVLKINSPARGFSGIRLSVIEALIALVNAEVYPLIPAKGSVGHRATGAAGAYVFDAVGRREGALAGGMAPGDRSAEKAGLEPITLEAKEGLALLNGTQASTAFCAARVN